MNIKKNVVGLATSGAVATVAGVALAAPATAMVLPGDPPYDGIYPTTTIAEPGTPYGQIALGVAGGLAIAGAGAASVVLIRRRGDRPVHTA